MASLVPETADIAGAAKQAPEARNPKDGPAQAGKPGANSRAPSPAADETLAKEALEGLKRIRAKARLDKLAIPKPATSVLRPAVLVAKPPARRPPWVAPLATLAVALGLVIIACTGMIVYLTMRPAQSNVTASAEMRNLRDTVTQLRRQVLAVSENLDGVRSAVDLSSKATSDRFGRFAENLDRIERVNASSTAKLDRIAQVQVPTPAPATSQVQPPVQVASMVASAGAVPEITGSVAPSERGSVPRKAVKGWAVRQAYDGIAILQGPAGVVEVVLGQQVSGLGRIEEIRSENGRLVVLSSAGAIYSPRKSAP